MIGKHNIVPKAEVMNDPSHFNNPTSDILYLEVIKNGRPVNTLGLRN